MPCPTVSIVVLCHNRPEYTSATLDALARVPCGVEREIIAVDNGSDPPTRDVLRAYFDRGALDKLVHVAENLGTSSGFNLGFAVSDGRSRFLTKLDNDIVVQTPGWLAEICAVFADVPKAGIVATEVVNHPHVMGLPVVETSGHRLRDWDGWVAGGGGMTIPRALYGQLGGFSTAFPEELKLMPDDLEYYHRVQKAGYKSYYACAAKSHQQVHLDGQYQAYQHFKDRQYHLLETRFFDATRFKRGYAPWIVAAQVTPARAAPGGVLRLQAQVNAAAPAQGGLGMSVRPGPEGPWLHDPAGDRLVTLDAGTRTYEREFRLPADAPAGKYDISVGLYDGQPGDSDRHDHLLLEAAVEVHGRRRRARKQG